MIRFKCPSCQEEYEAEDNWLGVKVSCESCKTRFYVPKDGQEARLAPPRKSQIIQEEAPVESSPASDKIMISFDDDHAPSIANSDIQAVGQLSPRQRRLLADAQMLRERFSSFGFIRLAEETGNPPEKYILDYNVKGIERINGEQIIFRNLHRVEINLPGSYPRMPPVCRMLTPIFHPNIEPAVICIGDHWTAGERLCDLVVRIGELITYQSYNIKSPLDGEAAMWADLHADILPVDHCDLMPSE